MKTDGNIDEQDLFWIAHALLLYVQRGTELNFVMHIFS